MNRRKRELIESLVEIIRSELSIPCPIEDIDSLVNLLGGELVLINDPLLLDGRVYKLDNDEGCKFRIEINKDTSKNRKKFTVAHELGHLFMHMGYIFNSEVWEQQKTGDCYLRSGYSEKEYEANEFAAALLMPKAELSKYIDALEGPEVNLSEVADHFNVSALAAFNRCKFLDLIDSGDN